MKQVRAPHGRWQHFEVGGVPRIANMIQDWKKGGCDDLEITRRLIDLFFVSVLLDAGSEYERSEGIAVASLHMFNSLAFAAEKDAKTHLVDGKGLEQLKTDTLEKGFQVSDSNPMPGVDTRAGLLRSLGESLLAHSDVFGAEGRPGNLDILQSLIIPIWPSDRTTIGRHPIGDAWPLSTLQKQATSSDSKDSSAEYIQPFHKLTQWLTYSLIVPIQRVLGLQWTNTEFLTALAEYRNGGLFVDLGVLSLKKEVLNRGLRASGGQLPLFEAGDDVIVEWRVMTLVLIDKLYSMVLSRMNGVDLTLAQLLEAGTWKSGREVATRRRPETKSSPIMIKSDGTVF
ncbi:DUF1688-domain-containing protein [Lindgomyces ingoldianus]|uniref:DUF1688-domain-containing protein n=1 Tax=Lindgomyces ingoldianus TaxID=673940 RepID=A0ACB6RF21_9PLEO|nr:DUF1688-domain-containing protein [Lindgomyces ingoldianus]KAF2477883.1 DUF1688-domain-containing protein [Lindgomyces ingoldianus]